MMRLTKTVLEDEILSLILWINNESKSTGLIKVKTSSIPINLRMKMGPNFVYKNGYAYTHMDKITVTPTLRLWNIITHTLLIRSIIKMPTDEQTLVLNAIANYLGVEVNYSTMTIRRIV